MFLKNLMQFAGLRSHRIYSEGTRNTAISKATLNK